MSFLVPPPRRPPRRGRPASRFRRVQRPREELAGRVVQAIVMSVLALGLVLLLHTSIRLLRAHFLAKYGSQAWLLPIIIGLIFLFILYRLLRLWSEVLARSRELKEESKSLEDKEDSS